MVSQEDRIVEELRLLKVQRLEINDLLLTSKDRKLSISTVNGKISKLKNELNDITHFMERNKANRMVDQFGGYHSCWWNSPNNKYEILCSHMDSKTIRIDTYEIRNRNTKFSKYFNLSIKSEVQDAKDYIFDCMIKRFMD